MGIRLSPLELLEKLVALVPLPHVHLVRYGGCVAPHNHLRGAIIPTRRQHGLDEPVACPTSPRWSWARLLQRVFALDMARCPWCQQGMLRIIAVITQGEVISKILHHLKLSADPPRLVKKLMRPCKQWFVQQYHKIGSIGACYRRPNAALRHSSMRDSTASGRWPITR